MKRPVIISLTLLLIGGLGLTANCGSGNRQPAPRVQSTPIAAPTAQKTKTVDYKGVSFTFDTSLAREVKSETIPASLEGKPSDILPEHPGFTLVGYPRPRSMSEVDPEIRVFSIAEFRKAMHHASQEMAKSETSRRTEDWGSDVDAQVRILKTLIAKRPNVKDLGTVLQAVGDEIPQMPFLPEWEASQAFVGHVKYVNFKNGKGVFFLTQWDVSETSQVTNQGLEYAFQGITDDGQYYVYAEFSVAAPTLPKGDEPDVVAWNEKNYRLSHKSKEYQDYLRPVFEKLEALPADKFQPNLELLEQLIGSLEVKTGKQN